MEAELREWQDSSSKAWQQPEQQQGGQRGPSQQQLWDEVEKLRALVDEGREAGKELRREREACRLLQAKVDGLQQQAAASQAEVRRAKAVMVAMAAEKEEAVLQVNRLELQGCECGSQAGPQRSAATATQVCEVSGRGR